MSNTAAHDHDPESPDTILINTAKPPRYRWHHIILVLRAHIAFHSTYNSNGNNAQKGSSLTPTVSSTSYNALNTHDAGEIAEISLDVSLQANSDDTDNQNRSNDLPLLENGDSKPTGTAKILPITPQVSLDVHLDGNGDQNGNNRKCQHVNIARIAKTKDLVSLRNFGGVQGIAEALDTDLENGIPSNEEDLCCWRIATTLSKTQAPARGFFGFLLKSCNSYIIFLLLLSAVFSLGFGIKKEGIKTGWYEGVIIILVVVILVVVHSIRDYWHESLQKSLRKQKLSKKREMVVDVFRGGCQQKIFISDVVLGDIVCLKRGQRVPADGLFISGEFLELDDCLVPIDDQNPFLFYGSKVNNGNGRMLVTCVGMNTAWGDLMSRVTPTPKHIQLLAQLDKVIARTQIIGLIISILVPIVSFLHFELGKEDVESGLPDLKGKPIASKDLMEAIKRIFMKPSGKVSILTTSLTMLLVGIVEGLPFVVTLAITFINKTTLSHKALAQDTLACVTMGLVTTICTDKTGGLTLNPMEVDMCWIGEEFINEDSEIAPDILEALCDGISTLVLIQQNPCSSTNDPLLSWATSKLGMKKIEIWKQSCTIVGAKEANSNDEGSGVLIRKNGDGETSMCLHWRGPATTILAMCSHYYDSKGMIKVMDENKKLFFEQLIEHMQSKHLKTIAFAYKRTDHDVQMVEENNLILIGVLCLKLTSWEETSKAMKDWRNAGVDIKLVSEDSVSVLKAIAEKCGMLMLDSNAIVLEGEEFRNFTDEERMNMVDRIVVMGNCLPSDRLLLVQCLKRKGNVVAVVGVRTTETPALKEANVGLAMGAWSSEMARESSDILIWDGNLSFLVTIGMWGRCVDENIRKYIQLELTITIAGWLITFITVVSSGDALITATQLVWANLIMTVLGGLALLTERPTEKLMDKPPRSQTEPLITKVMWRNIVTQVVYQATILVIFLYKGQAILGINQKVSKSMIFNSFVLCQVFNQFNAREMEKKNVFKGIHHNHWFWVAVGVTVVLQAAFIEIASVLVGTARLNCEQWAVCSLIGMVSWVIHWAGKCTSDFIKYWFIGSISMTPSAPLEFACNLELPLINGESTAIPS